MDTPAPSPSSVASRPRWRSVLPAALRFSIRELLLLTTTVAALVALFLAYYQKSQPFSESLLSREFGTSQHIRSAAAPLPPHLVIISGGGDGGGDKTARSRAYEYSLKLPRAARGKFIDQLHNDAKRMLDKDERSTAGSLDYGSGQELAGFNYKYHGGPSSRGFIVVRRVDVSEEIMHLVIFIYEHEDRR